MKATTMRLSIALADRLYYKAFEEVKHPEWMEQRYMFAESKCRHAIGRPYCRFSPGYETFIKD